LDSSLLSADSLCVPLFLSLGRYHRRHFLLVSDETEFPLTLPDTFSDIDNRFRLSRLFDKICLLSIRDHYEFPALPLVRQGGLDVSYQSLSGGPFRGDYAVLSFERVHPFSICSHPLLPSKRRNDDLKVVEDAIIFQIRQYSRSVFLNRGR